MRCEPFFASHYTFKPKSIVEVFVFRKELIIVVVIVLVTSFFKVVVLVFYVRVHFYYRLGVSSQLSVDILHLPLHLLFSLHHALVCVVYHILEQLAQAKLVSFVF